LRYRGCSSGSFTAGDVTPDPTTGTAPPQAERIRAQTASDALSELLHKAAADFARLVQSCGPRERRDPFAEDLTAMERLLGPSGPMRQDVDAHVEPERRRDDVVVAHQPFAVISSDDVRGRIAC
jgi:hypothetical protein